MNKILFFLGIVVACYAARPLQAHFTEVKERIASNMLRGYSPVCSKGFYPNEEDLCVPCDEPQDALWSMKFKTKGIEGIHDMCFHNGVKTFSYFSMEFEEQYSKENNLNFYPKCDGRTCVCDKEERFCLQNTCNDGLIPLHLNNNKPMKCIPKSYCLKESGFFFLNDNLRPGRCMSGCNDNEVLTAEITEIEEFERKGPIALKSLECSKCEEDFNYRIFEVSQDLGFINFAMDFCIKNGENYPKTIDSKIFHNIERKLMENVYSEERGEGYEGEGCDGEGSQCNGGSGGSGSGDGGSGGSGSGGESSFGIKTEFGRALLISGLSLLLLA